MGFSLQAACDSVWQGVTVCCSVWLYVLQCVTAYDSAWPGVVACDCMCCSVWQRVSTCDSVCQCVTACGCMCCSVWLRVTVWFAACHDMSKGVTAYIAACHIASQRVTPWVTACHGKQWRARWYLSLGSHAIHQINVNQCLDSYVFNHTDGLSPNSVLQIMILPRWNYFHLYE